MASGLPVVVSDWNGYKDTVLHGKTGYRVTTYTTPTVKYTERSRRLLSDKLLDSNSFYGSLSVSINEQEAVDYINDLINSPIKLVAMSSLARRHATIRYSWKTFWSNFVQLLDSLNQLRLDSCLHNQWFSSPNLSYSEIFYSWASFNNSAGFKFSLNPEFDITHLETFLGLMINNLYYSLFPSPASVVKIYLHCRDLARPFSLSEYKSATQSIPYDEYTLIISFLFKHNYIIPA
jgi:hypothetical protein